jgi:large subunit ribosomal protein L24
MSKAKIKRDDVVVVIAGKHKGSTGRVLRVLREEGRIVVERINLVKRQVKPSGDRPGGTVEKEAPIHVSNVALWNAEEGRRLKPAWSTLANGVKVRIDKKTGTQIDRD